MVAMIVVRSVAIAGDGLVAMLVVVGAFSTRCSISGVLTLVAC